jgi:hypothetical protein
MYHAGQMSAQLRDHARVPFHVEIINAVTANARTIAVARLMRALRSPCRTPRIAGRRKRSRQNLDRDSIRNLARQNRHGEHVAAMLTQRVRRDIDPTTKPPVHEHPISSNTWQISKNPSCIVSKGTSRNLGPMSP